MSKKKKATIRSTIGHLNKDIREAKSGIRRDRKTIIKLKRLLKKD